ncbi:MAG TPA: efflux RND transporter periplasmic adaptor subunit, partial [Hyphomicrobiaceae bacterium]|nr:efflux RND transporter periplasmic adaptor subunit [Hyphomicrobiaceae bacterium]
GFPREVFAGAIQRIDSRVDPVARSVRVRAAIPNGTDKLRPGMSFVVELNLPGKPYWKVPELALQFSQTGNHVWVVENGRARKVEVTLVKRLESAVLVDGAIPQGGLVVIEGVQRIRDGAKVEHGDTGINTGTNTAATPANTSTAPVRKSREAGRRQGGG